MEDLREAARCYMKGASEEYKQRALKAKAGGESLENFYVHETKRCIRRCNACLKLVLGFYFCCTKCELYKGYNYNLCVKCFYGRKFQHEHDSFADHSVLMMHNEGRSEPTCVIEKNKGKGKQDSNSKGHASSSQSKEMIPVSSSKDSSHSKSIVSIRGVRESNHSKLNRNLSERKIMVDKEGLQKLAYIAEAHYNAAPQKIRDSADKFFWSMVKQRGKTRVTMEDFLEFMKEKRYPEYAFPEMFQILVKDRNLGMSLPESRTVYYILLSRRPFCSWCKCFIPDMYFCCSKCSARSYALCLHCYANKAYLKHRHYGVDGVFFMDYTVLHTTIKTSSAASNQEESGSSKPIVKANKGDKLVAAWTVVEAFLNAGSTFMSFASLFGACTIM